MPSAKPELFTFWEGPKPDYIKMCQLALLRHCHKSFDVKILDEKSAEALVGRSLPFRTWNHKTDWLKCELIRTRGGFWIDADMLVMKDFISYMRYLDDREFIGIPGFFGARRGAGILNDWSAAMANIKDPAFSDLIQPLITDKRFMEFVPLTRENICPIYHTGDSFWRFFDPIPLSAFVTDDTHIVTLYNSSFSDKFKAMSSMDILTQPWLLSKMFKRALFDV